MDSRKISFAEEMRIRLDNKAIANILGVVYLLTCLLRPEKKMKIKYNKIILIRYSHRKKKMH